MHFPITLHLGSMAITLHAVLEVLAFVIGYRYFLYRRKHLGDAYSSTGRTWVIIGAAFGAVVGSRLVGCLEEPEALTRASSLLIYILSNKSVIGGFLGGLAGVELTKKILGEKRASGDLFVFPMLLALFIGRVGCFSMGVHETTYGRPTSFTLGMDLGDGINRHPLMLYELIFLALLWMGLAALRRRMPLQEGALFKLLMIAYLAFRLGIEFLKPRGFTLLGISTIQIACIGGLFYYLPYLAKPRKLITQRPPSFTSLPLSTS